MVRLPEYQLQFSRFRVTEILTQPCDQNTCVTSGSGKAGGIALRNAESAIHRRAVPWITASAILCWYQKYVFISVPSILQGEEFPYDLIRERGECIDLASQGGCSRYVRNHEHPPEQRPSSSATGWLALAGTGLQNFPRQAALVHAISGTVVQWCVHVEVTGPRERKADQAQRSDGCWVFQQRCCRDGEVDGRLPLKIDDKV